MKTIELNILNELRNYLFQNKFGFKKEYNYFRI